jgi:hypothetical protein
MNVTLIRQDPALQGLPPWFTITAGVGVALLGAMSVLIYVAADRGTPPDSELLFTVAFTVVWLGMAVFLLSPGARTRATDFSLGLPIEARSISIVHHIAVLLASLATWALLIGIFLVGNRVVGIFGGEEFLPKRYALDLAVSLPVGFSLVIAVLQAPARERCTLPLRRSYAGLWVLTVFGTLILTLALIRLPLAFVFVLPAAAAAVLLWNRNRAPLTFLVAPREAAPGAEPPAATDEAGWAASRRPHSGLSYHWFLLRTVHRATMKKNALPFVGYPTMLVLGAALSGVFAVRADEGALRFDLIVITAYMVLAFFGGLIQNLHRVDALPISRRRLLAMLVLPPVLTMIAGYAIGLGITAAEGPRDLIALRSTRCCGTFITLPAAWCDIAWNGEVPAYEAPWNETHTAWSVPVYRGSRARVYSPFNSSEPASERYVALQISRAIETVYNRGIPEGEILSRYLDTDASGGVTPAAGEMHLPRDYPGLHARYAGPAFPILMMLVCVPGFLLSALYLGCFRAGVSGSTRNRVLWGLLAALLAVHLGQYVLLITRFMRTWVFEGVFEIAIRKLGEAFPGSVAVVWVVSGVLIYLAYRTAERAFGRIEVAARPEG